MNFQLAYGTTCRLKVRKHNPPEGTQHDDRKSSPTRHFVQNIFHPAVSLLRVTLETRTQQSSSLFRPLVPCLLVLASLAFHSTSLSRINPFQPP